VQTTATGRCDRRAAPRAQNAPDRSSKIGIAVIRGWLARAIVNGVDREPGQITTSVTPTRTSVSANTEAHNVLRFVKSIPKIKPLSNRA
jgi:hypothetical protein